jgi:DNA end-binding protein Ku
VPRAIWSGSISFGLVNIPIKLFSAVSKRAVSFNQIDSRTGSRVRMQRVSAADGSEVPYEDIVKGYEVAPDRYVVIEPDELDAIAPEASHTIDLEAFVDLPQIDPVFFDAAYHVAPATGAARPYALLVQAMEDEGKVGVARFVMRTRQYLAALRPKEGYLMLSTMFHADEIVPAADIPELRDLKRGEVAERELTMAKQLISSLDTDFDATRFHDDYRERVLALIEHKAAGEEFTVEAEAPAVANVVDLMEALEASVREAREARGRHPTARDPEAASNRRAKSPAKKASRRRSTGAKDKPSGRRSA